MWCTCRERLSCRWRRKNWRRRDAYDALIAIGCVLRGETSHYDYVCSETARGLQLAQMDTGLPIIFCVLTCDTLEQAIDRAGLKGGNKGFEAGLAAIEMARLSQKLRGSRFGPPRRKRRERRGASNVSLRTKSREFAMQMLFQWDMSQQDPAKLETKFWKGAKAPDATRSFANQLFEGTAKEVAVLDEMIVQACGELAVRTVGGDRSRDLAAGDS